MSEEEEDDPQIQQVKLVLKSLMSEVQGIQNVALVAREGLIVASILEKDIEPMKIAALSAVILSTCERVLLALKQGDLDVCIIRGMEGNFVVMECGEDHILVGVLEEDARLDLTFVKMRASTEKIVDIMEM